MVKQTWKGSLTLLKTQVIKYGLITLLIMLLSLSAYLVIITKHPAHTDKTGSLPSVHNMDAFENRVAKLIDQGKFKEAEQFIIEESADFTTPREVFFEKFLLSRVKRYKAKFITNPGEAGWDRKDELGLKELKESEEIIDRHGDDFIDKNNLILLSAGEYSARNLFEDALRNYKKIENCEDREIYVKANLSIAAALADCNHVKEGEAYLSRSLKAIDNYETVDPQRKIDMLFVLSNAYECLGKHDLERKTYEEIIRLSPPASYQSIQARIFLARNLIRLGDIKSAYEIHREIIKLISGRMDGGSDDVIEDISLFGMVLHNMHQSKQELSPGDYNLNSKDPFELHLMKLNMYIKEKKRKQALEELKILNDIFEQIETVN
ncbi:MAG: hypothetical protein M1269_08395 [Chloroflexi bacterium]|nr:hypothetical protein [Chloroflexota bacterium]